MYGNIKQLLWKSKKAVKEDGVRGFLIKARNWTIFQFKKDKRKEAVKDILFINGCGLPHPSRYRVHHQMEQLEANGLTVEQVFYTMVKPDMIKFYRGVVIFRCPYTKEIGKLIDKAHYYNKKVFFDIDDLVIDTKYTDKIEFVKNMNKEDKEEYDDGVIRMKKTMEKSDYLITTTDALKRELEKTGKEVFINKNVASEEMVRLSLDVMKNVTKDNSKVKIGYLSGSITHNPDFEMVKPALIKIMDEFPQTELVVMGHLDLPKDLKRFGRRIIKQPFKNWQELPKVIAGLDINLAPIEETVFNEAKSENKWTEASLCKVVTVASNFGAFRKVMSDGENGMLCRDVEDWYKKIKVLVEDDELRKRVAENAYKKAMKEYITTYSGRELTKYIESKLAKNIAFVLPSTNISGGVNVVLKHCDILRRNGWDVTIINMDASDENVLSEDGEVDVVSGIKHDVVAKFDAMVATLFTTLKYVRSYSNVRRQYYLVQNYETNFSDYGSPMKREANATYSAEGVRFITISEWCKDWLEKDYGQKAEYVPNGIDISKFTYRKRKLGGRVKILVEGNSDDYYKNVDESFRIVNKLDPKKYEITYLSYQGRPKKWYRVDKFYHKVSHDEVGEVYGESDILLKTSILESFSYPPLEMMATGGYVVAVPNGGNQEYLKNEKNCLFYEQGNIDEAVKKIERIVKDGRLRKELEKNGRKIAEERDWSKIEEKILGLYR